MTKELVDIKTGEIDFWTKEQTELMKRTVAKDLSDDEFMVFLNICNKVKLDPFAKQIYTYKSKGRQVIIVGIDGMRLIADRTGAYAPGRAPTFTYKDTKIESSTAYIMKFIRGTWLEVSSIAFMDEYRNTNNDIWSKMPHVMLAKCAEANALRRAFPNETSGLYTPEEMDQASEVTKIKMPEEKKAISTMENIPTDEDIIESEPVEEPIPWPEPIEKKTIEAPKETEGSKFLGRLHQIAREKGLSPEKMKASIAILFSKESSKDLTDLECSKLIQQIEKGAIKSA